MIYGDKLRPDQYLFNVRVYGKNGTMGPLEPVKEIRSHELCLVFEVTAPTQEIASTIAGVTRHQALHLPIPEWSGLITALACPYNHTDRGAIYKFNVNHVVEPDDPHEMFRMPDRPVAGLAQGTHREIAVRGFRFLQADRVRRGNRKPLEQIREPLVDVVYVECSYFH